MMSGQRGNYIATPYTSTMKSHIMTFLGKFVARDCFTRDRVRG